MAWRIEFDPRAGKDLAKIDPQPAKQVLWFLLMTFRSELSCKYIPAQASR